MYLIPDAAEFLLSRRERILEDEIIQALRNADLSLRLTEAQKVKLRDSLFGQTAGHVAIWMDSDAKNGTDSASDFVSVLQPLGWTVEYQKGWMDASSRPSDRKGIHIAVKDPGNLSDTQKAIVNALRQSDIPFVYDRVPTIPGECPHDSTASATVIGRQQSRPLKVSRKPKITCMAKSITFSALARTLTRSAEI
ncbi:MAG: hypothetical protein ACJ71Q_07820 [Terriglobales bacterium]